MLVKTALCEDFNLNYPVSNYRILAYVHTSGGFWRLMNHYNGATKMLVIRGMGKVPKCKEVLKQLRNSPLF